MKSLIIFLTALLFVSEFGHSQCLGTWNPITHISGTQLINGNNVTATPIGTTSTISCGLNGYWIANGSSAGSYLFSFSSPVNCFRILINAISDVGGNTEKIALQVNGAPYAIQASELICTPCASIPNCVSGVPVNLVAGQLIPTADDAEAELIIQGSINSIQIDNIIVAGSPNGSVMNVFFQQGTINDTLIADFGFTPGNCGNLTYSFQDSSYHNFPLTGWHWNFGDPASGVNNTSTNQNPNHTFTAPGNYNVTLVVTNSNNLLDTISLPVQVVAGGIQVQAFNNTILCSGGSTTIHATGALSYVWNPATGLSNATSANPLCSPLVTTTYTVLGTDANGCTGTSLVTIQVLTSQPITVTNQTPTICKGDSSLLSANGAINYVWMPGTGLSSTTGSSVWASPLVTTTYTVIGTDAGGCSSSATTKVNVISGLDLKVAKSEDVDCQRNPVLLSATGANSFQWSPASYVTDPNSSSTYTKNLTQSMIFYVTGTLGSCIEKDSIWVAVDYSDDNSVFIPSAFSPNYDGLNDCLKPICKHVFTEFNFMIYNRWGQKVYATRDQNNCWEGFFNNARVPQDTYYYYLKAKNNCGEVIKKGDVMIIR